MKRILVVLVALTCSAVAEGPTAQQCKGDLDKWVPMFRAVFADSACQGDGSPACPFAGPIRNFDIGQLLRIPLEAEACAQVDKRHRYYYQRVATRAENIVVMRTAYFLKSENRTERYVEWERGQAVTALAP